MIVGLTLAVGLIAGLSLLFKQMSQLPVGLPLASPLLATPTSGDAKTAMPSATLTPLPMPEPARDAPGTLWQTHCLRLHTGRQFAPLGRQR